VVLSYRTKGKHMLMLLHLNLH